MKAFYEDMERTDILERKLSQKHSGSGKSFWSRRSFRRSTTAPPVHPTPSDIPRNTSNVDLQGQSEGSFNDDHHSVAPQLNSSRSVLSETGEREAWFDSDAWARVPIPGVKAHYKLHNPLGPRWYRNHHLIPPHQTRPGARPPTFFSPSFPAIGTSSSPDHDDGGPSRTPSHSPLPTPTSSQTRVQDGGKGRSRKISQTDAVDLLDVTDPWGTNWHHQSPYEIIQPSDVCRVTFFKLPANPIYFRIQIGVGGLA